MFGCFCLEFAGVSLGIFLNQLLHLALGLSTWMCEDIFNDMGDLRQLTPFGSTANYKISTDRLVLIVCDFGLAAYPTRLFEHLPFICPTVVGRISLCD